MRSQKLMTFAGRLPEMEVTLREDTFHGRPSEMKVTLRGDDLPWQAFSDGGDTAGR
jgi:hypothetical protein